MPTMNHREVTTTEATENILKTILTLHIKTGHAYVSDIAGHLNMNLTTTYTVIAQMSREGLLQPLEGGRGRRSKKQSMCFTPEGEERARSIFERHQTIQKWLNRLGIPMDAADEEACSIEHGMSDRTMMILKEHVQMATDITSGKPENAVRTMRKLLEKNPDVAVEKTFTEQTMELLDEMGGTEGIARKWELLARADGEENLKEILDIVEEIGGTEQLRKRYREYRAYRELAEKNGGFRRMQETLALANQLGSREELRELVKLSGRYGGIRPLIKMSAEQYQLWQNFFLGRNKKEISEHGEGSDKNQTE